MLAFPLHMQVMTDPAFPFPAMGMVHLENTITQHRSLTAAERFDVSVSAARLRPHTKGRVFDMLTEITVAGEVVWSEVSTYLRRGGGEESAPSGLDVPMVTDGGVEWRLPGDLGRRYAAVSGDRNPIHLYPLTAKAFGFPRNIAHGMWTKARSLAALSNRLPDAFVVDVEFRKPILLPATVVFGSATVNGEITFGVVGARKPSTHLVGRVSPR